MVNVPRDPSRLLLALVCLAACADGAADADEDDLESEVVDVEPRVQLARAGAMFEVSPAPSGLSAPVERARGAIHVAKRTTPTTAVDGTPLRHTCGAVLIAPSFALTAAHCVDSDNIPDPKDDEITLEMYPTLATLDWIPSTVLTTVGDWFDFEHPMLGIAQGYKTDTYSCELIMRCGNEWGPQLGCNLPTADTALLRCDGKPGIKHGVVNVAQTDEPLAEVFMPWSHEVYNIIGEPGDDLFNDHYTKYVVWQGMEHNIHYFGGGRNQLLPLRSRSWPQGDLNLPNVKTFHDATFDVEYTTLIGCHGTSGAPIFQFNPVTSSYELLGPASRGMFESKKVGNGTFESSQLCQEPTLHGPYSSGLSYSPLAYTQHVAEQADDCSDLLNKGPILSLRCAMRRIKLVWPELWFPWDEIEACPACGVLEALQPNKEQWLHVKGDYALELPLGLRPGAEYRFSAAVAGEGNEKGVAWAANNNGEPIASVGTSGNFDDALSIMSGTFIADRSGALKLGAEGELSIGHIAVAPADGRNTFDSFADRVGVGLRLTESLDIVPARFAGTRNGSFEALLDTPSERLVLTREALGPSDRLEVSGHLTHGSARLAIGAVTLRGEEFITEIHSEVGSFTATLNMEHETPVAVFIELRESDGQIGLDWVSTRQR